MTSGRKTRVNFNVKNPIGVKFWSQIAGGRKRRVPLYVSAIHIFNVNAGVHWNSLLCHIFPLTENIVFLRCTHVVMVLMHCLMYIISITEDCVPHRGEGFN